MYSATGQSWPPKPRDLVGTTKFRALDSGASSVRLSELTDFSGSLGNTVDGCHSGILSTFPPTRCGIATFSAALGKSLIRHGHAVSIVRVRDNDDTPCSSDVAVPAALVAGDRSSIQRAAAALNSCDLALIQHEYGLYGGDDGADVLEVVAQLRVPSIAILHTVLPRPTTHQREVVNALGAAVDGVVVMTEGARNILRDVFDVDDAKVRVIPHGASITRHGGARVVQIRPIILTWGLIGPGKGIEWVIDAMAQLKDLSPRPLYVIAGQTHPKVLTHEGDKYRESLEQRVAQADVSEFVAFDNTYRDLASLGRLISSSSVVVLPYDSVDQATSGVLVDAVAAGRPVIATTFPHARELLSTGAGITVAHQDPTAIAAALRSVLSERSVASAMAAEADRISPTLSWDAVASQYEAFALRLTQRAEIGAR